MKARWRLSRTCVWGEPSGTSRVIWTRGSRSIGLHVSEEKLWDEFRSHVISTIDGANAQGNLALAAAGWRAYEAFVRLRHEIELSRQRASL